MSSYVCPPQPSQPYSHVQNWIPAYSQRHELANGTAPTDNFPQAHALLGFEAPTGGQSSHRLQQPDETYRARSTAPAPMAFSHGAPFPVGPGLSGPSAVFLRERQGATHPGGCVPQSSLLLLPFHANAGNMPRTDLGQQHGSSLEGRHAIEMPQYQSAVPTTDVVLPQPPLLPSGSAVEAPLVIERASDGLIEDGSDVKVISPVRSQGSAIVNAQVEDSPDKATVINALETAVDMAEVVLQTRKASQAICTYAEEADFEAIRGQVIQISPESTGVVQDAENQAAPDDAGGGDHDNQLAGRQENLSGEDGLDLTPILGSQQANNTTQELDFPGEDLEADAKIDNMRSRAASAEDADPQPENSCRNPDLSSSPRERERRLSDIRKPLVDVFERTSPVETRGSVQDLGVSGSPSDTEIPLSANGPRSPDRRAARRQGLRSTSSGKGVASKEVIRRRPVVNLFNDDEDDFMQSQEKTSQKVSQKKVASFARQKKTGLKRARAKVPEQPPPRHSPRISSRRGKQPEVENVEGEKEALENKRRVSQRARRLSARVLSGDEDSNLDSDSVEDEEFVLSQGSRRKKRLKPRSKTISIEAKSPTSSRKAPANRTKGGDKSPVSQERGSQGTGSQGGGSQNMQISVTALKGAAKRKRGDFADYLFKKMTTDELAMIREAFIDHYPPPPSNMQAQGRFEQMYGREMSQAMINGLWKKELEPWSERWWKYYNEFNELARQRKLDKPRDRDPSLTKQELKRWAKAFYKSHGNARIPAAELPSDAQAKEDPTRAEPASS